MLNLHDSEHFIPLRDGMLDAVAVRPPYLINEYAPIGSPQALFLDMADIPAESEAD
jgi:tRNA G10  N-methylase Trm11